MERLWVRTEGGASLRGWIRAGKIGQFRETVGAPRQAQGGWPANSRSFKNGSNP